MSTCWGQLVLFAVAVSVVFRVGGFCFKCCRALLDKPKLRESFLRLCGREAAFQLAVRNHITGMGALASLAMCRRRFLRRVLPCTVG